MNPRLDQLVSMLLDAHRSRTPVSLPEDLTAEEAYDVQDKVFAALGSGARPAAWKVGSPSEKVEPMGAQILPGAVHSSPAALSIHGYRMAAVEAEIGFRMADKGEALEAIVTIEVCDTRLANWPQATPAAKLADFQSNAALVAGSGSRNWRDIDFRAQRAQLWIDGRMVREATGAHPYGSPARLLPWAAAHCARRGSALRAGDLVTTGSWTGMEPVRPGSEVRAIFPGLGEAVVQLAAGA